MEVEVQTAEEEEQNRKLQITVYKCEATVRLPVTLLHPLAAGRYSVPNYFPPRPACLFFLK